MSSLSRRGQRLAEASPMPAYIVEHFTRVAAPSDSATAADAYIGLCIAENKLSVAELTAQLASYAVPERVLGYDAMSGNYDFRRGLSKFMARSFLQREFDPEQIVLLAGAGSILEMLFYAICDAGDGVLVPTPSYAGFWADLETRDELRIVPVDCSSDDGFKLTVELLDATLSNADRPVKALLFTNPNNPLGCVYSEAEIKAVVDWSARNGIHLIVDEIYALSVFGTQAFISVASVCPDLGDHVHIVWAFSKDFGASGLRCGVLVSENQALVGVLEGLAYWAACSGHTQHLLASLVADDVVVDTYLESNRTKLKHAYTAVTGALKDAGIPYIPAEAAFFLICDLRGFLEAPTWAAEHALWRRLLEHANVNLTPGEACRINEPGFFRLCYAGESTAAVVEAITRIGKLLASATR